MVPLSKYVSDSPGNWYLSLCLTSRDGNFKVFARVHKDVTRSHLATIWKLMRKQLNASQALPLPIVSLYEECNGSPFGRRPA